MTNDRRQALGSPRELIQSIAAPDPVEADRRVMMEDKVPVKILEIGEGVVLMIVCKGGRTARLRDGYVLRSQMPVEYAVERRLSSDRPAAPEPPTFRREGQYWRAVFEGSSCLLEDCVGVRHIARLLQAPGQQIRCDALLAREPSVPALGTSDLATDLRSLRQYRARRERLTSGIDAARREGDIERALLLEEERDRLDAHLRSVTGKNGNARRAVDSLERARQAVSAAIRRTMKVLRSTHPSLWSHLYRDLKLGLFCEYRPNPIVNWRTS